MIIKNKKLILLSPLIVVSCFLLESTGREVFAEEYVTHSGKSLYIEEFHPQGQSLSSIHLKSSGFNYNLSEVLEDCDPINSIYIRDLDGNGFDEFYIITISSGSGSYGDIIAYASDRDNRLLRVHFPKIQEGDECFSGYMGHDRFYVTDNKLVRVFPIYLSSDKNINPTGGRRELSYSLFPGEASWQLKIVDFVEMK